MAITTPTKEKTQLLGLTEAHVQESEGLSSTRFDENSDLSMTYLGRIDMTSTSKHHLNNTSNEDSWCQLAIPSPYYTNIFNSNKKLISHQ